MRVMEGGCWKLLVSPALDQSSELQSGPPSTGYKQFRDSCSSWTLTGAGRGCRLKALHVTFKVLLSGFTEVSHTREVAAVGTRAVS